MSLHIQDQAPNIKGNWYIPRHPANSRDYSASRDVIIPVQLVSCQLGQLQEGRPESKLKPEEH